MDTAPWRDSVPAMLNGTTYRPLIRALSRCFCIGILFFCAAHVSSGSVQRNDVSVFSRSVATNLSADSTGGVCPIDVRYVEDLELSQFHTGDRLASRAPQSRLPRSAQAEPRSSSNYATAPGRVYLNDPEDGSTAEVQLERLFGDGSLLDGRYSRVHSDRLERGQFASRGLGGGPDFRFVPKTGPELDCMSVIEDCSRFDAVNVYYHIDRFATLFWKARLGIDPSFQAIGTTHISGDGAFTNPREKELKIGLGDIFMKNSALADDIIYHEYTHLVTNSLGFIVERNTPEETRALNEGYADYFAATFTDDPRIGEWVVTCPDRQHCVGPPNDLEFRTLLLDVQEWNWAAGNPSEALRYGVCTRFHEGDGKCKISYNNFAHQYVWGMIWAAGLWDLRGVLGATATDRLAVESVRKHSPDETISGALSDLLEADRDFNEGRNLGDIRSVFSLRGIFPDVTGVRTETRPDRDDAFRIGVYPNPASSTFTIEIENGSREPALIYVFDITGREVLRKSISAPSTASGRILLDVAALPDGLYLIRVLSGRESRTRPLVLTHYSP
jgi:Secretion system C-terminal sorting domain